MALPLILALGFALLGLVKVMHIKWQIEREAYEFLVCRWSYSQNLAGEKSCLQQLNKNLNQALPFAKWKLVQTSDRRHVKIQVNHQLGFMFSVKNYLDPRQLNCEVDKRGLPYCPSRF